MDPYTDRTRAWLDERFRATDDAGVYIAHQPVYGFRRGHSEPGVIARYLRTHAIMEVLSRLDVGSLVDVGAAEGYKAALARELFGLRVAACDLSAEACKRCGELYEIPASAADVHDLPYADGAFDVALCSETLEHVADVDAAIGELLRVAARAVVITVPHESRRRARRNARRGAEHAHIHHFDSRSFVRFGGDGRRVIVRRTLSPWLRGVGSFAVAMPKTHGRPRGVKAVVRRLQNALVPLGRRLFDRSRVASLIELDSRACGVLPGYGAVLAVILKQPSAWHEGPGVENLAERILQFAVSARR